ncbi:MAG: glycosyltransferase family 39 protein [Clostridiales bacterium]|nr:glycosyltransferase family 39 protein [Clostridiales bacterium]
MYTASSISQKKKSEVPSLLIICGVILILTFCLSPYSPFYRYCFSSDEVCYKTISMGILHGKLPYRDLFDHKGPLTYFLFAFGFLISGGANWGAFLVCYLLDAFAFIFSYKTCRLFLSEDESLLSVILTVLFTSITIQNIYTTGSKPENMLLAPLMISTYLFMKHTCSEEGKETHIVPAGKMFLIGLCCGAVFMIKLNVCLFYLAFVGCYFLWLLVKKHWKNFFCGAGAFLAGIAAVTLPCMLFYYVKGGLQAFFDVYFVFNLKYSGGKDGFLYLTKRAVPVTGKISLTVFLLLIVASLFLEFKKKTLSKQKIIMAVLGLITFVGLTFSFVCTYFFIVFMPFFLYGTNFAATALTKISDKKTNAFQLSIIAAVVPLCFVGFQLFLVPYVPSQKEECETVIEEYAKAHPDADYVSFCSLCLPVYDQYLKASPDFRMFYIPLFYTDEVFLEHAAIVRNGQADVVVYREITGDDAWNQAVYDLLASSGYKEYYAYRLNDDADITRMFVLE